MRILLVADGRSPITRRWLTGLAELDDELMLVSTFPCNLLELQRSIGHQLTGVEVIPVAFSRWAGSGVAQTASGAATPTQGRARKLVSRFRSLFLSGRYWLGPLSILLAARSYRKVVKQFNPDIIHALRVPFEGMLAAYTPAGLPLVVSIWGNDLTLHARGSTWMRRMTMHALRRAQGLVADASRDIRLGKLWGVSEDALSLVVPGSGGIHLDEIASGLPEPSNAMFEAGIPSGVPLVINPRGFRPGSVRNDTFFQAIPGVLARFPTTVFLCPAMAGQSEALAWVKRLGIEANVRLLPYIPQADLWGLFRRSVVSVSPSAHDGTPNSMLEAMACGCFPIAGDIESIREWIIPGVNGLLVDPGSAGGLSSAIVTALSHPELLKDAVAYNVALIARRADHRQVFQDVDAFYQAVLVQGMNSG